jgi:hypothetical protein
MAFPSRPGLWTAIASASVNRRRCSGSGAARKRLQPVCQVLRDPPVAPGLEQALHQLLRGLLGLQVAQLVLLLARQQQAGLQLEQRGDQDEELRGDLEVQLAARLEVVEVGEDDLGEVDLEQVDLLLEDQGEQQVERPAEHLQVELETRDVGGRAHGVAR